MIGARATCALLLASLTLPAQTIVEAKSNLGVFASQNRSTFYAFVRQGSNQLTLGKQVARMGITAKNPAGSELTVEASLTPSENKITASLSHKGSATGRSPTEAIRLGTSDSADVNNLPQKPNDVLFVHAFLPGIKRKIELSYLGKRSRGTGQFVAEVDVGDDGTVDWRPVGNGQLQKRTIEATAGARGILVRVRLSTTHTHTGGGTSTVESTLSYCLEPGTNKCAATSFGTSCGPKMAATLDGPTGPLRLTVTGGSARQIGFLLLGKQRLNVRLPGTSCFLYTPLTIMIPHLGANRIQFTFNLPPTIQLDIIAQDLVGEIRNGNAVIQSSNGAHILCGVQ